MTVTVYGIKNCNTMQKTFAWLDEHGVGYAFHDYKKAGADRDALQRWCTHAGWEKVINRAGMTFRKLPDEVKANLDETKAIALMLDKPSMIRRPVLEAQGRIEIGFSPERYAEIFAQ